MKEHVCKNVLLHFLWSFQSMDHKHARLLSHNGNLLTSVAMNIHNCNGRNCLNVFERKWN